MPNHTYDGRTMPKRVSSQLPCDYTSEHDDSPELDPTKANYLLKSKSGKVRQTDCRAEI